MSGEPTAVRHLGGHSSAETTPIQLQVELLALMYARSGTNGRDSRFDGAQYTRSLVMFTPEQREFLIEALDRLIDLFVQHDEATRIGDWGRVDALEIEIADATASRDEILNFSPPPAPG
jgi:hypothetical protein